MIRNVRPYTTEGYLNYYGGYALGFIHDGKKLEFEDASKYPSSYLIIENFKKVQRRLRIENVSYGY